MDLLMGFRGKPRKGGAKPKGGRAQGALGGLAQKLGGGMMPGAPGMGNRSMGTFRVYADGSMMRIAQKRRRKGYRMPSVVREQLRASTDLTRAVAMSVAAGGRR